MTRCLSLQALRAKSLTIYKRHRALCGSLCFAMRKMPYSLCKILSSSAAASLERAEKTKANPTLNVHVAEPIDSSEGQKLGRQERMSNAARVQG